MGLLGAPIWWGPWCSCTICTIVNPALKCVTDWKGPIMGALPEVVCMRDWRWEESVQDMSRIGYHIFE